MIRVRLLGELEVFDGDRPVALPPSRKTRALLAYLALAQRPQRRERLCEMFWEIPDDPRGALRWSLSKLRGVLDRPGAPVVEADRLTAGLRLAAEQVDVLTVRDALRDGVEGAATQILERLAGLFRGPFLADLDLPQHPELQSWIAAQREDMRRLHAAILRTLDARLSREPDRALAMLRALVELDRFSEADWARLVARLNALGRRREAEEQYQAAVRALADVGGPTQVLERARRVGAEAGLGPAPEPLPSRSKLRQEIRFCRAADGARIAYALAGEGAPLVKAANWLNHLEYDWESPIWDHFFRRLARNRRLLRYDSRGNGLSDWDAGELSLETWVSDLEAVVDAAGYERFPLLGMSQGCAISIAYAAKHPERVSHLVLYAGFASGTFARTDPVERAEREALTTLIQHGWGQDNSTVRRVFTSMFIPGATPELAEAFNELQRRTTSPEGAVRHYRASARLDVRPLLAKIRTPTLVLHPRGDCVVSVEAGRKIAAEIPDARFEALPGQNHLFLEDEPAADLFFDALDRFLQT